MPRPSVRPVKARDPITRRTWLSWVGNATVCALVPDAVGGCGHEVGGADRASSESGGSNPLPPPTNGVAGSSNATTQLAAAGEGSGGITGNGTLDGVAGSASSGLTAFAPSALQGPLFASWKGNTVDPQDLTAIVASWVLSVEGLVEQPLQLAFADLLRLQRQDQVTDFHCVEGWSVLDVPWNGVHIDQLIDLARPSADATHLTFHCVGDVYQDSVPLTVAREPHTLLAYGIGGNTLPLTHGFPLRLVVPRLLGYKSAKWVNRIVFTDAPVSGYWEQRGYGYDAEVPATRLRDGKY